jgi:hypothetical protein
MPLVNSYATLATLKARLRITASDDDARLESLLTTASRQIDNHTGRRFYAATETRSYAAGSSTRLDLDDDLLSITTLTTDEDGDRTYEVTWDEAADYYLTPVNATLDGRPYSAINVDGTSGNYRFPAGAGRVQIAGSFGYCATGAHPAPIEEATLRLAERLYVLATAPLGIAGTPETGVMRIASDRDLQDLLWPYTRRRGFA